MNSFDYARWNDPLVSHMLERGCTLEQIIGALTLRHQDTVKRLLELVAIAPKKIQRPDGRVFVWHCPDELIPLQVLERKGGE